MERKENDNMRVSEKKGKKVLKLGIEPKTFALLARRSNQLSYSSSERSSGETQISLMSFPFSHILMDGIHKTQ